MAGISTAIEVQDRVSGSLNRITAALYNTTSAFQGVDSASNTAFNVAGVQAMTQELYAYEARIQDVESELANANRKIEQMQEELDEVKKKANGVGDSFGSIGKMVAGLGLGMLVKQQVGSAIEYASDLEEVQNVVSTVFGDNSAVEEWSKKTLESFGLNELTAKRFTGTLGAMLSSSGLGQEAEAMSMKITELAGDMASFYNLDATDAFNKLRSGISGETEPLKQLGINMSAANLEAFALSQGITTAYKDMDQASQTMLRYQYLMNATANAQGDFSKTSESYSNQVKLLKENWTAFTGELASSALPLLASAVGMLNSAVSFISEHWNVVGPILAGMTAAIGVYTAFTLATKGAAIAQAILNAVQKANPTVLVIMAIVALIGVLISLCNWIAEVTGVAQSGIGVIVGALAVAGAVIWNIIVGVLNSIIQAAWSIFVEPFLGIIEWILNACNGGFNSFGGAVANLLGNVISWFLSLGKVVTKIVDAIFGTNWTDGLNSLQDSVLAWGKSEESITIDRKAPDISGATINYGDAFKVGAEWGDGLVEKLSGANTSDIDSAYTTTDTGSVADSLANISANTSDIKDSVDISDENLAYLRDIAERDVINRFTTAEIKVDMNNTNNIASNMDIDGIVEQLTMGVQEAMEQAAEGVHA